MGLLRQMSDELADLVARAAPGVVGLSQRRGQGSGVVLSSDGYIVTNSHVAKAPGALRVRFSGGGEAEATLVGADDRTDLAVVRAAGAAAPSLMLPDRTPVRIGELVIAIGNPLGLERSVSLGVVSALHRDLPTRDGVLEGLIQTDASVNPGNSGGPLLDSAGRLIGVNAAIISPSGSSAGIGFAIPVDEVNRVVPRLIRNEKNVRPGLGITPVPDQIARQRGVEGVIVLNVDPDGPAAKAGLRTTRRDERGRIRWGDVITAVDSKKVGSANELAAVLEENYEIGQQVVLTIERDGEEKEVRLTLTADTR
jgi:S1-C subfamily serine protease